MASQVTVIERGSLPLTPEMQQALDLRDGTEVLLRVEEGRLIIEPVLHDPLKAMQDVFVKPMDHGTQPEINGEPMSDEEIERSIDQLHALLARRPGESSLEDDLYKFRREEEEHSRRKYGC